MVRRLKEDKKMGIPAGGELSADHDAAAVEQRAAPRFTALIRSAKLVCGLGEFICVVRDVSSSGVRLRCFHDVPRDPDMALVLPNGESFAIEPVRGEGAEASFRFLNEVPIEALLHESKAYPRRPLRLNLALPVTLRTLAGPAAAVTRNISQQGCCVESPLPLALAQQVIVESPRLPGIRAKVQWRQAGTFGLVFDDTFSLRDFAIHVARLQSPALVSG